MADHDFAMRALRAFLDEFVPRIEEIAQQSAGTEAALYATRYSEEKKANMRLEFELMREVECWKGIRTKIDERVTARQAMLEGLLVRREAEWAGEQPSE